MTPCLRSFVLVLLFAWNIPFRALFWAASSSQAAHKHRLLLQLMALSAGGRNKLESRLSHVGQMPSFLHREHPDCYRGLWVGQGAPGSRAGWGLTPATQATASGICRGSEVRSECGGPFHPPQLLHLSRRQLWLLFSRLFVLGLGSLGLCRTSPCYPHWLAPPSLSYFLHCA